MMERMQSVTRILRAYRRIGVVLLLAIVPIALMGVMLSESLETLDSGVTWIEHEERVRFALAQVLQSLVDAGGGINIYQVTHDAAAFDGARAAEAAALDELGDLRRLIAAEPTEQPLVERLGALADQRLRETRDLRDRALRGDVAGLQSGIASGATRRTLADLRKAVGRMENAESQDLARHAAAARRAHELVAEGIWATSAMAGLLLVIIVVATVRHAERLRSVQEELATTLRSVGDAVIATDAFGQIRFLNTSAESLTGWTSDAARGLPLERVFAAVAPQHLEAAANPVSRVLREGIPVRGPGDLMLRALDGTERPVESSAAPIVGPDGRISGVVLIFRDATVERAARRALIETSNALREADQRKDVFLATLSHELRNPLAPIRMAARVLETPGASPADLERSRRIITRQVGHMASLLNDLLDVSRISRGALTLKRETVELQNVIDAAVETAEPIIAQKRQDLRIEAAPNRVRLEGDPVRLTQVVANLLTNAAKYTDAGGRITLRIEPRPTEGLVIAVRDTGIGIEPEMLPKVFEMFTQLGADRNPAYPGLGIGLALVKGFTELHGGRIEAQSEGLGHGSEFRIVLPESMMVRSETPLERLAPDAGAGVAG